MRNNTLYNIVLPLQSNDVLKVAEEHSGHLTKEQFMDMYHTVIGKGKHDFLLIDYKAPEEKRFRHNFDKIISFSK
ncbi:MAG: hypothetical protein EBU08_22120 [Micrococcales bacterium]|nr:hypothetical protein [Micrococcales bacterium]